MDEVGISALCAVCILPVVFESPNRVHLVSLDWQRSGLKLCGTIINARGIPAMDANGLIVSS